MDTPRPTGPTAPLQPAQRPPTAPASVTAAPPRQTPQIQHVKPGIGQINRPAGSVLEEAIKPVVRLDENRPLPVADSAAPLTGQGKITAFGKEKRHEDSWSRTPNTTGAGAIHVKTFHCKLTDEALLYMDQTINEWLDAHPQYEVKFVHSTIGTFTGKLKEPALICQVWV